MTTLSTSPTYVVPRRPASVVFSLSGADSNFVRVWVTVAPEGSKLAADLSRTKANRFEIYQGRGGADHPLQLDFDLGGKYTFVAQEYTKGNRVGPGYQNDPRGAPTETQVGSETTLELFIGQRCTQQLGVGGDTAKLILWVWDDTIRATTEDVHGEITPAIDPGTPAISQKAKNAAESEAVETALAALVGVRASTAIGVVADFVSDYVERWNDHIGDTNFHAAADGGENELPVGVATATGPNALSEFVNAALRFMRQHFTNDDGTGVMDAAGYHDVGGKRNDWKNMPIVPSVNGVQDSYAALGELYRCFEAHRVSAPSTISYVSSQAQSSLSATTSTSITIPTVEVDDILIVPVVNRDSVFAPTVTDDDTDGNEWKRVDPGSANGLTIWWKRATAATTGKIITVAGTSGSVASGVSVFRGCARTVRPYQALSKTINASGTESHSSITTTSDGAHVVLVVANRTNDIDVSTQAATDPATLTERIEVLNTGGDDCSVSLASAAQTTAGPTGNLTWAQTNAETVSAAFALIPDTTAAHTAEDTTNALLELPPLLELHRAFFAELAAVEPTPPPAQSDGAVLLVQIAGFLEEPPTT